MKKFQWLDTYDWISYIQESFWKWTALAETTFYWQKIDTQCPESKWPGHIISVILYVLVNLRSIDHARCLTKTFMDGEKSQKMSKYWYFNKTKWQWNIIKKFLNLSRNYIKRRMMGNYYGNCNRIQDVIMKCYVE